MNPLDLERKCSEGEAYRSAVSQGDFTNSFVDLTLKLSRDLDGFLIGSFGLMHLGFGWTNKFLDHGQ